MFINIKHKRAKRKIKAKRAFILGVILLLTIEYIKTGRVWKDPLVVKYETVKSSKETEKESIIAPIIEGAMLGKITLKKTMLKEHPRSKAASIMFGSICLNFGRIVKTTYGIAIVICAINTVMNPNSLFKMFRINFNKSIKETPVITSEFKIGI